MKHICTLLAFIAMSACGPYRVNTNTEPLQETEKVVATDLVLKNLNIVKINSSTDSDGRMTAYLEMENEKNKDIWVDVQVIFKDAQGMEIERSSFEPYMFNRRMVTTYKRTALKPGASDFRIVLRNVK